MDGCKLSRRDTSARRAGRAALCVGEGFDGLELDDGEERVVFTGENPARQRSWWEFVKDHQTRMKAQAKHSTRLLEEVSLSLALVLMGGFN